jgi:hypothetical protein
MYNTNISAGKLIDLLSNDGNSELVMLQAYLDESGTHKGASLVVVAGWVGQRDAWKAFIKEWSVQLKKAGISYFHAKDPKCESLKPHLVSAILKRKLLGVAWTVNPLDFKENATDKFTLAFGNAYSTCAYLCAGMITRLAKRFSYDSVAIVFESGQSNEDNILKTLSAIMEEPVDHRIASINFLNKKHPGAIPLQAADFLSHAISTNETKWIKLIKESGKFFPPIKMPPEKLRETSRKVARMIAHRRKLRKNAMI